MNRPIFLFRATLVILICANIAIERNAILQGKEMFKMNKETWSAIMPTHPQKP